MRSKKLTKSLDKFYQKKENVQETLYGELGIPINGVKRVDVPGRAGYVYVRLHGNASELIQAYNSTVPTKYDYPVVVSRKKNTYTILGRYQAKFGNMGNAGNSSTAIGYTPLPNHGGQHSFNQSLGMGADPVWVFSQQFMPQLVHPSGSSMLLAVNPHFYEWEGQWKYPQTTTPSFAPYVPTITGSARMALLFMDGDTGALNIVGGVGFSGGINNASELVQYIPDIDRNNSIPLVAVKLGTGTTSIGWNDIYDMRDFYTVSKYFQGIGIQDGGTPAGTGHILNFGNNLAVSFAGNVATIDASAGGGIGVVGWNEGVLLGTGVILNFVGDWVDASISGTVIQVRVTGSASTVPIADSGGYFSGVSVEAALQEIMPLLLPIGVYQHVSPLTANPSFPYAQTIHRQITPIKWTQHIYVATTNDGSNYWTITIKRISDGATIATISTSASAVNTQLVLSTTSFSNTPIATSALSIYWDCSKVGAPGALYMSGPGLEFKY